MFIKNYKKAQFIKMPPSNEICSIRVEINDVTNYVPLDPNNTDYQNIMKLVEEGKLVIAPAEETNNVN